MQMIHLICVMTYIFVYLIPARFTFGYVAAVRGVEKDPWKEPVPMFFAIFWPLYFIFIFIFSFFRIDDKLFNLGVQFRFNQMKRIKLREEETKRMRVELQEAEVEIESDLRANRFQTD